MGLERHGEDPYQGPGCSPKLTLVGRIAGMVDGRPWLLSGDERAVTLELPSLSAALKLRGALSQMPDDVMRVSSLIQTPLRVRIGRLPTLTLGPRSLLRRFLLRGRKSVRNPA